MILKRHKRTAGWLLALGSVAGVLFGVEMNDRAGGPFQVRSTLRAEARAPVAAFVDEVYCDEGQWVSPGSPVVRLKIPDLASRLAAKQAEVREAEAKLRLLEMGPRPEELIAQRQRVQRAGAWRDLAEHDLARARQAFQEEVAKLQQQVVQSQAELDAAQDAYDRAQTLLVKRANSEPEYREAERKLRVCQAQLEQARVQKQIRQTMGTLDAETELARREKDLAGEQAVLALLEAGTRPEQIDAQRAELERFQEELQYLEQLEGKLLVRSSVPGVVTTPRLREKVGKYLQEGEAICVVEELNGLEAEIAVSEQDVGRVRPGQPIILKARALPFETFQAQVDGIAPIAAPKTAPVAAIQSQGVPPTVTVYCRLPDGDGVLRPGMTGYARIYTGRASGGKIAIDRVLRFLRTEFWW